jgi:hypothetical protein
MTLDSARMVDQVTYELRGPDGEIKAGSPPAVEGQAPADSDQ